VLYSDAGAVGAEAIDVDEDERDALSNLERQLNNIYDDGLDDGASTADSETCAATDASELAVPAAADAASASR
jgi:hypothetical protein